MTDTIVDIATDDLIAQILAPAQPPFVAELCLGADAVAPADRERIVDLVHARATAGGFPIPVAVAWNTVHFWWDPLRRSYQDSVIYGDELPMVDTAATTTAALPIGAVVWVKLGDVNHWAELVGKDGRPDGLDDGIAPATMVAAAAAADDNGDVMLREAWAFDFEILGPADQAVDSKLRRLARRSKLDKHCLYVVGARYDSATSANDTDAEFFTRWMVENQAALLLAGPLGDILLEDDDTTLAASLAASMASIADICDVSERLVRWGDTWMPVEWIYDIEDYPALPLHAHDLEHIAAQLVTPGRNVIVGWVSLGQRLDEFLERQQHDDPYARGRHKDDRTIFDDYAGAPWLKVLARSGRWIADVAAAHNGTLRVTTPPRRLRVDDTWAHGSLWRSAPTGHDHPLVYEVPEDIALGLGADPAEAIRNYFGLDTLDDTTPDDTADETAEDAADETADDSTPEPQDPPADAEGNGPSADTDEPDEPAADTEPEPALAPQRPPDSPADLEDSIVSVTVAVRAADIAHGTLTLPTAMTWLDARTAVTVRITHEGTDPTLVVQQCTVSADQYLIEGLEWPDTCFEGIRVGVSALVGGTVLSVLTRPLDEPIEISGVEYRHQFDRSIVDPQPTERPLSLSSLLISTISRHGRDTQGTRRASAAALTAILFGADASPLLAEIVARALGDLHERGRLKLAGTEYLWHKDLRATRPRRFVADDLSTRDDLITVVRRHIVYGHLRRLTYWQSASGEAIDEYQLAHRQGNRAARSPHLPNGYTWVREHPRGYEISTTVNALAVVDGGLHSRADIERDVRRSYSLPQEST